MARLGLSLILAVFLMASAGPVAGDDPWPEGWRVQHFGTPSRDLRFVDPLHGWGSNYNNRVLRTTDGAQTWSDAGFRQPFVFVTPLIGWVGRTACCPAAWSISNATDGGQTWTEQVRGSSNYCGCGDISFLHFVDTQYGWAEVWAGYEQSTSPIKTTDGGRTWTPWTNKPASWHLKMVSPSVWYWLEHTGDWNVWRIYKTTDGGATTVAGGLLPSWTAIVDDRIPDVASDTNTLVVAGEGGRIARSTDFGLTWQEIPNPLTGDASMPRFADDNHGWAFAGKTLVGTVDGGRSWQLQSTSNTGDIKSFVAVDADHAYFVAERLYRTTDGGATWVALPYASDRHVTDLAATPGGKLYAAGSTFATGDGGLSWNEFGLESIRVDSVGEDNVWAAAWWGRLNRSTDAGKTWTTSALGTDVQGLDFVDADRGWAVSQNAIYKSEDGGASWREIPRGAGCQCDSAQFSDVFFIDAQRGWILAAERARFGAAWFVISTTDGGATWIRDEPAFWPGGNARLNFISASEGWLAGCNIYDYSTFPLLLHTTDGGRTWQASSWSGSYFDCLSDVDFAGLNGWAVGGKGLILHTTDGGATWEEFRYLPTENLLSVEAMGPDTVFVGGADGLVLRWDKPPGRLYLPLLQ